jgi:hypothetical protein
MRQVAGLRVLAEQSMVTRALGWKRVLGAGYSSGKAETATSTNQLSTQRVTKGRWVVWGQPCERRHRLIYQWLGIPAPLWLQIVGENSPVRLRLAGILPESCGDVAKSPRFAPQQPCTRPPLHPGRVPIGDRSARASTECCLELRIVIVREGKADRTAKCWNDRAA